MTYTEAERIYTWTRREGTCLLWQGATDHGHAKRRVNGRLVPLHREIYAALIDAIPEGFHVHHTCENRACLNPFHLEALTASEHAKRHKLHLKGTAAHAPATHCKRGHEFSSDNLYIQRGGARLCKTCQKARYSAYRSRLAARKQEQRLA